MSLNALFFRFFLIFLSVLASSARAEDWFFTPEPTRAAPQAAPAAKPESVPTSPPRSISNGLIAPPPRQDDLWQRIRDGFALPDRDGALIDKHEQWYANRPDYVARMTERSGRYLYFIVEEVERRGMPTEIALLPMIESAYNPSAYSISHASGIWQFIPSTGKNFGLHQNWWYDGRRDIVSATRGALNYLEKLHAQFGDWELALAAYNWGEGAVARAQQRNRKQGKPINYSSLKMPDETRNYVPKLLAIKRIIAEPTRYGITLPSIADQPYFTSITTGEPIDVKVAAQLADISMEEFTALNPAHNRPVILQDHANTILLPVEKIETFRLNLGRAKQPLVSWQAYQSQKGERLDKVAPRFGLSVDKLRSVNGLTRNSEVSTGQTLLVPKNGEEEAAELEPFNLHLTPPPPVVRRPAASKPPVPAANLTHPTAAKSAAKTRAAVKTADKKAGKATAHGKREAAADKKSKGKLSPPSPKRPPAAHAAPNQKKAHPAGKH